MKVKHILLLVTLTVYFGCNSPNNTQNHSQVTNTFTVSPIVIHDTVYIPVPEVKTSEQNTSMKGKNDTITYEQAMKSILDKTKANTPFYGTTVLSGTHGEIK